MVIISHKKNTVNNLRHSKELLLLCSSMLLIACSSAPARTGTVTSVSGDNRAPTTATIKANSQS